MDKMMFMKEPDIFIELGHMYSFTELANSILKRFLGLKIEND